jgi:ribonuclease VapC
MIVVDASILVAIIREEDEAALFTDILDETESIMSAVSYVETHMVVAGRKLDPNPKRVELTARDLGIEIVDVTADQTEAAIRAFIHYGKGRHKARLNLADCFTYGLAKSRGMPLLFKGDDFALTDIVSARRA